MREETIRLVREWIRAYTEPAAITAKSDDVRVWVSRVENDGIFRGNSSRTVDLLDVKAPGIGTDVWPEEFVDAARSEGAPAIGIRRWTDVRDYRVDGVDFVVHVDREFVDSAQVGLRMRPCLSQIVTFRGEVESVSSYRLFPESGFWTYGWRKTVPKHSVVACRARRAERVKWFNGLKPGRIHEPNRRRIDSKAFDTGRHPGLVLRLLADGQDATAFLVAHGLPSGYPKTLPWIAKLPVAVAVALIGDGK